MNTANIELTRAIIQELAKNESILQGARIDVHCEYRQEHPNLEGDWLDMRDWVTDSECGTAACLVGWLARDPRIQAAGLRLEEDGEDDVRLVPVYGVGPGRSKNLWALRRFLGFREIENAIHIFGPDHPNTFDSALLRLDEAIFRESELNHA